MRNITLLRAAKYLLVFMVIQVALSLLVVIVFIFPIYDTVGSTAQEKAESEKVLSRTNSSLKVLKIVAPIETFGLFGYGVWRLAKKKNNP